MKRKSDFEVSAIQKNDWAPGLFLIFFIAGAILIASSKALGASALISIMIPVIIMVCYGYMSFRIARMQLRLDQLGDNIYYLGFLLTLVSLSVTLYQYSSDSDEDFIVSNFGIALAATIFGIAGRAFLSQMRKDTTATEKEMQASLSEASLRLRSQVFAAVEGFSSLHRQMSQITQESIVGIAQSHRDLATGLAEIIDEHTKILQNQVEESSKAINAKTNSLIDDIDSMSRSLNNALKNEQKMLEDTAAHARKTLSTFENVTIDTSSLKSIEENLASFSLGLNTKLSAVAQSASRDLEVINNASKRFGDSINKLEKNIESSSDNIVTNLNQMGSHTLQVQKAIAHLSEKVKNDFDSISTSSNNFSLSLNKIEEVLINKSDLLTDNFVKISKETDLFNKNITNLNDNILNYSEKLNSNLDNNADIASQNNHNQSDNLDKKTEI